MPPEPVSASAASQSPPTPSDPKWWNRLGVRLTVAIALFTLATIAVLLFLVLRAQQRHMVATVVHSTELLSDTIRSSTYHDMLQDRREDVYRMMEVIGRQEDVERVRIFNKEGRITFSTDRAERGTFVDKRAESCYACHAADRPIVRPNLTSRVRTFTRNRHRVIAMVTPIYNDESCSTAACHVHPTTQRVLGVVDLSVSLAGIDTQLADLRTTTIAVGTCAVVAFAVAIAFFLRRSVIRPIEHLRAATRRIAHGELTYRVRVHSEHEIGELERSFNDMAQSLAKAREDRLRLLDSLEHQVEERTAELKRAQQQLVRSEKLSSLGRLAASIAHEINNPLAGILTYAKLLIRSLDDPTGQDASRIAAVRQLKLVQRETERCTSIVRNLLDFARERALDLKDVSVNQVLEDALLLVANQARLANIELRKSFDAVPAVHADFNQLRQAFINLLINACDAMPKGGSLTLTTRGMAGGLVEVSVADTGCGISKDHLSKVLDPFFTTKDKGTGLGLSVVYGIVERHGGSLDIASEEGVGTTVIVRLPVARSAGSGRPEPAAASAGVPRSAA